jgi:hypothetical protein
VAKTRKTIVMELKVTAPAGMRAGQVKREVLTRINHIGPHFDAFALDLPYSAEDDKGYIRVRASLAKRER